MEENGEYEKEKHRVELQKSFIKYFNHILFDFGKSLPVFGTITDSNPQILKSSFGDMQLILINYFSKLNSFILLPNISIELISCWYRHHHPVRFSELFSEENTFFKHMIDLLQKNQHQFKKFRKSIPKRKLDQESSSRNLKSKLKEKGQ
jgi:hypothetical protein